MTLLTAAPQRHSLRSPEDRRPQRKRSGGQQGRAFEHSVRMPPKVLSPISEPELQLLEALEILRTAGYIAGFGWEDVCFSITRSGSKNGQHGSKIPDASIVTRHGIVFLELSEKFSRHELDTLEFLRTRYQVQVIAIDHRILQAIRRDPGQLRRLIAEAERRLELTGRGPFEEAIRTARKATLDRRNALRANANTGEPTRVRTPRGIRQTPPPAKAAAPHVPSTPMGMAGLAAQHPAGLAQHVIAGHSLGASQPQHSFAAALAKGQGSRPSRAGGSEGWTSSSWEATVRQAAVVRDGRR